MSERRSSIGASMTSLAAILLCGCATLPAQETLDFENVMAANGKALGDLAAADQAARIATAQAQFVEDDGRIALTNCAPDDVQDCTVTYSVPNAPARRLRTAAANVRALQASLERYATQMHTLAEAKDLQTVKAEAQATAASVKALAVVAGVPGGIAGAIVDGAALAQHASLIEKRRRAMLENALAARPAVKIAADRIGPISDLMRRNVIEAKALEMKGLEQRNDADAAEIRWRSARVTRGRMPDPQTATRMEMLRQRRADGVGDLVRLSEEMNRVRESSIPVMQTVRAHDLLIYVLENPKASTEDTLAAVIAIENALVELTSSTAKEQ